MPNLKFSQFTSQTELSNFDGLVGFRSDDPPFSSGADRNYYITVSDFYDDLEDNLSLSDFTQGILPIARGGTGVDNYGDSVTAVLDTNVVTGGTGFLVNPGNSTTHVAPLSATTVNDDAALYVLQANQNDQPADWNGAIQVTAGGKYLVEAQYASYGNQSGSPEMNMWVSVVGSATGNNGYNSAYPTGATVGDVYPFGGGVPSKIENGSAVIRNSQIITISANDYVRIMWRVDGFLTAPSQTPDIYPDYNALASLSLIHI